MSNKDDDGKQIRGRRFEIECHGLKPLTVHRFFFSGIDSTANCFINTHDLKYGDHDYRTANGLLTDTRGKLDLFFHVLWPVHDGGSKKVFSISATDSSASNTVTLKA